MGFEGIAAELDPLPEPDVREGAAPPGDGFDPDVHATDADGRPKRNKDGSYRRKRGSRAPERSEYRPLAEMTAQSIVAVSVAVGGDEFGPVRTRHLDEMENLTGTWESWFEAQEMTDLPPNLALAIGLAAYFVPRLAMPGPRGKAIGAWKRIRGWFGR